MFLALLIPLLPFLVKRVLVSLGIGILTYGVVSAMTSYVISEVVGRMSQVSGVVLQMASLFGVPDAIGIYLGAFSTIGSLAAIRKFGLI